MKSLRTFAVVSALSAQLSACGRSELPIDEVPGGEGSGGGGGVTTPRCPESVSLSLDEDEVNVLDGETVNARVTFHETLQTCTVSVLVRDKLGNLLQNIGGIDCAVDQPQKQSGFFYSWNGTDQQGNLVPNGAYVVAAEVVKPECTETHKALVMVSSDKEEACDSVEFGDITPSPFDPSKTSLKIFYEVLKPTTKVLYVAAPTSNNVVITTLAPAESALPGIYETGWNGENALGEAVAAGKYHLILQGNATDCLDTESVEVEVITSGL